MACMVVVKPPSVQLKEQRGRLPFRRCPTMTLCGCGKLVVSPHTDCGAGPGVSQDPARTGLPRGAYGMYLCLGMPNQASP